MRWWVKALGVGVLALSGACGGPLPEGPRLPPPPASWTERAGPNGGRFAVPPGWRAWVGEEARRLQAEGARALPEILRPWVVYEPDIVFVAHREEAMIRVSAPPAHTPPEALEEDPTFREDMERFLREGLSGWAETIALESGGRFRLEIREIAWGKAPGALAALRVEMALQGGGRSIPVREWVLLQPNRTWVVVGMGEAPVEEFLRRSAFPGGSPGWIPGGANGSLSRRSGDQGAAGH